MLNADTKRHIDAARDVLVGVAPNPMTQIDQITYALIYKFMDDMDEAAIKAGGDRSFFTGELAPYAWSNLVDTRIGSQEKMDLFAEALTKFAEAPQLPELFRTIFRAAFLPYRSPETLGLFIKEINYFDYSHPEELGNAYEYLLSIMSAQGDAGQFRTPRHIIDFMVDVLDPTKDDTILDPACGTGGFLVSSYNHILEKHDGKEDQNGTEKPLTPAERKKLTQNLAGYDIDPSMVRIAQVNMYLHQFKNPQIFQYDGLTSEERWNEKFDVILANPPFMSPKGGIKPHNKFGIKSNRSEVLFVDYIVSHLKPNGRAAIVVPEGIIFQGGNAYKAVRKMLIEEGLHAVVSLPSGVFQPYSGVKTSILFIDRNLGKGLNTVQFIEVKNTGFSLGASKKVLDANDLPRTVGLIHAHLTSDVNDLVHHATVVEKSFLENSGFNLSESLYKDNSQAHGDVDYVRLSEVCHVQKGKSSSTKSEPGPYPLVLTAEFPKTSSTFDFSGAGVAVPLISATGHGKADVRRVHIVEGEFALANLLAFVEPIDPKQVNTRFLFHVLNGNKDGLAQLMKGAANVSMKVSDLALFKIPLPPLRVQEQIVSDLDRFADIVSGAKQIVDSWKPMIEINPEWTHVRLADVAVIDWGNTSLTKSSYVDSGAYLGVSAAGGDGRMDHFEHEVGTTVLSAIGANCGRMFYPEEKFTAIKNTMTITPKRQLVSPKFLFCSLQSNELPKRGAGQPFIAKGDVVDYEIALPQLSEQEELVIHIETEEVQVNAAKKLIETYEAKTQAVIAKLWSE